MSLVGFRANNHRQQVGKRGANDKVDDRGTLPEFIAEMEERFGVFDLDVAASFENAKARRFYTAEDDGLSLPWIGNVWCNPPYSGLAAWVSKAWEEWDCGNAHSIVMLLPANRTEQKWWQDHIEHRRDRSDSPLKVEFLPGRMRFIRPNAVIDPRGDRPPFGCVLAIWRKS